MFGVERERGAGPPEPHRRRRCPERVEFRGKTPPEQFRAALRRSRAYVGGARWEDYGQAPLEALADGARWCHRALGRAHSRRSALARELAPELVRREVDAERARDGDPSRVRAAEERLESYRERAAGLVERFRPEAVQRTVAAEVVPALLG